MCIRQQQVRKYTQNQANFHNTRAMAFITSNDSAVTKECAPAQRGWHETLPKESTWEIGKPDDVEARAAAETEEDVWDRPINSVNEATATELDVLAELGFQSFSEGFINEDTKGLTKPSSQKRRAARAAVGRKRKKRTKIWPKRPLSAYNYFFQQERARLVTLGENGESEAPSFEDMGRIIGQKWRQLPEADRSKYHNLAQKDAERYQTELQSFDKARKRKRAQSLESSILSPIDPSNWLTSGHISKENHSHFAGPSSSTASALQSTTGASAMKDTMQPVPKEESMGSDLNYPSFMTPSDFLGDDGLPLPAGTVITLTNENGEVRNYNVHYAISRMTKEEAAAFPTAFRLAPDQIGTKKKRQNTNERQLHTTK